MNFFDYIRDWFIWATQTLVWWAIWLSKQIWPLDQLYYAFKELSDFTSRVAGYLYDASNWYDWVADRVADILSWSTIWSYIKAYIPNWDKIGQWFSGWTTTVIDLVTHAGSVIRTTIEGWIAIAKQFLQEQINSVNTLLGNLQTTWDDFWTMTWPQWMSSFNTLSAAWGTFWTQTFPTLATWSGAGSLITSALKEWFPFYDSLVSLWDGIAEFFADPEDWLYKAVDRIIERFW